MLEQEPGNGEGEELLRGWGCFHLFQLLGVVFPSPCCVAGVWSDPRLVKAHPAPSLAMEGEYSPSTILCSPPGLTCS